MLGDWGEEFVEDGGGWRLYSRVWQTQHLGRGVPPSSRRRCQAQGWGVGRTRAVVQLMTSAQAGTRVGGDGCGFFALVALGNPG